MKSVRLLLLLFIITVFMFLSPGCSLSSAPKKAIVKVIPHTISISSLDKKTKITLKSIVIKSIILNKFMKANIFVPPGYTKTKKYSVLYMLPGSSGEQSFCMPGLKLERYAYKMIADKKINPLIIVSPALDNSFGLNSRVKPGKTQINNKTVYFGRYQDYLTTELVNYIDAHYSTIQSRDGRYIGGISDGGYVALRTAFLHPYEYSKVGAHSPNLNHENPSSKIEDFYFPEKDQKNNKDIYYLAKNYDLSKLKIYIDCGNKDTHGFDICSQKLYNILKSRSISPDFHLNPGTHGNLYWEAQLPSYLTFYSGK